MELLEVGIIINPPYFESNLSFICINLTSPYPINLFNYYKKIEDTYGKISYNPFHERDDSKLDYN